MTESDESSNPSSRSWFDFFFIHPSTIIYSCGWANLHFAFDASKLIDLNWPQRDSRTAIEFNVLDFIALKVKVWTYEINLPLFYLFSKPLSWNKQNIPNQIMNVATSSPGIPKTTYNYSIINFANNGRLSIDFHVPRTKRPIGDLREKRYN